MLTSRHNQLVIVRFLFAIR